MGKKKSPQLKLKGAISPDAVPSAAGADHRSGGNKLHLSDLISDSGTDFSDNEEDKVDSGHSVDCVAESSMSAAASSPFGRKESSPDISCTLGENDTDQFPSSAPTAAPPSDSSFLAGKRISHPPLNANFGPKNGKKQDARQDQPVEQTSWAKKLFPSNRNIAPEKKLERPGSKFRTFCLGC